jgi:rare lipoprotein A
MTRLSITFAAVVVCAALPAFAPASRAETASAGPAELAGAADPAGPAAMQEAEQLAAQPPVHETGGNHPPIDRSGRKQAGKASFYGKHWAGREMANGRRFNPESNTAASKSLPLGTVAKVTNLANGKSELVHVEDRGPYVAGRVVDLTAGTAKKLGFTEEGVVPVLVAPVAVPQRNGEVKPGAGAAEVPPDTAAQAMREARSPTPGTEQEAKR